MTEMEHQKVLFSTGNAETLQPQKGFRRLCRRSAEWSSCALTGKTVYDALT